MRRPHIGEDLLIDYALSMKKNHTKNIKIYEKLMAERNSSFKNKILDNVWLDALENQMSDVSISIAETRLTFIGNLNKVLETNLDIVWPKAILKYMVL